MQLNDITSSVSALIIGCKLQSKHRKRILPLVCIVANEMLCHSIYSTPPPPQSCKIATRYIYIYIFGGVFAGRRCMLTGGYSVRKPEITGRDKDHLACQAFAICTCIYREGCLHPLRRHASGRYSGIVSCCVGLIFKDVHGSYGVGSGDIASRSIDTLG